MSFIFIPYPLKIYAPTRILGLRKITRKFVPPVGYYFNDWKGKFCMPLIIQPFDHDFGAVVSGIDITTYINTIAPSATRSRNTHY